MNKVYVFLANGFEEIEAFAPIDIMRRAGIDVITVSTIEDLTVVSTHGIAVMADTILGLCDFDDAVFAHNAFFNVITNNVCAGCGGISKDNWKNVGPTCDVSDNLEVPDDPGFADYAGKEAELPFDQHWLLASLAPRLVAVGSAEDDHWACPSAEHASIDLARPAWGGNRDRCHYHIRPGGHAILEYDWVRYIEHADKWVK